MAAWLEKNVGHVNTEIYRAVALLSLATHLFLVFFSGIRRRRAYGFWRLFVWAAYQVANWAPVYVLGNLFLGDAETAQKQKLVAFWVPFLLLHLARPDNISAYAVEDHATKVRMLVIVPVQSLGAAYVLIRYILVDSTAGTLMPAACIMNVLGIFKYWESLLALWRGDLDKIRSKTNKQSMMSLLDDYSSWEFVEKQGRELDDEKALLLAHDMLYICKSAFCDSWVEADDRDAVQRILSSDWKNMCKVVEMELSLMYDMMYTKAAVVHTWHGYAIRVASPPLTATALLLFWLRYGGSPLGRHFDDVKVSYILLWTTLALDVRCLLTTLASTWTYSFLKVMPHCWFSHELLCRRRWEKIRCFLSCPVRLLHHLRSLWTKKKPKSYRRWSGKIGQHNLLYECTGGRDSLYNTVVKRIESEDNSVGPDIAARLWEMVFHTRISQVLFKEPPYPEQRRRLKKTLPKPQTGSTGEEQPGPNPEVTGEEQPGPNLDQTGSTGEEQPDRGCPDQAIGPDRGCPDRVTCPDRGYQSGWPWRSLWEWLVGNSSITIQRTDLFFQQGGPSTHQSRRPSKTYEQTGSDQDGDPETTTRDFQEVVLTLHITTDLFLWRMNKGIKMTEWSKDDKAIKAMSDYMLFLVAVRPRMLPGLQLRSLYDKTRDALMDIWPPTSRRDGRYKFFRQAKRENFTQRSGEQEEKLAMWMLDNMDILAGNAILLKGTRDAEEMLKNKKYSRERRLEELLDVWVTLLLYASTRCSRESHANQLGRGGELTTILWIITQHAADDLVRKNCPSYFPDDK